MVYTDFRLLVSGYRFRSINCFRLRQLPVIDLLTTDKLSIPCTKKPIMHLDTLKPRNIYPKDVKQHFFHQLCPWRYFWELASIGTLWHVPLVSVLTGFQGHPTNLFLTLSVPHRNLAGWQNIRCSNELAGKFLIVRGFGWELLTFLAFQAELAEKLWRPRTTEKKVSLPSPRE